MRLLRRLRSAGVLLLAAVALGAVFFSTVRSVQRLSSAADDRRLQDRLSLARAFAASVREVFESARRQAAEVAAGREPAGPGFSGGWVVFDATGRVTAASGSRHSLLGFVPPKCTRAGEAPGGAWRSELPDAGKVSAILDTPGDCKPGVAVSSQGRGRLAVVLGLPGDVLAPVAAAAHLEGVRVMLVDSSAKLDAIKGGRAFVPGAEPVADVPSYALIARNRPGFIAVTRGTSEGMARYAPISDGWGLVIEQDAATFDIESQNRPSLLVGAVLAVVFGIVLALLAIFELRRRRAHRRSEDAKSEFFAIAGHELRTPLTSLRGFSETLALRWSDLDEERRRMLVERMVPQVRRMSRVIERMLLASSIRAETHVHPRSEPVDVGPALEQAAQRFRAEAPLHVFEVEVEPGLPRAIADAGALDQVLDHLLDNAVKYSPAGGNVRLTGKRARHRIEIVIDDEGVGLPSDTRRIFEPLVQGEDVDRRVHGEGGVGVGLFVVRTLVREMGGDVRAERREPAGARFVVRLPVARAAG